MLLCSFSFPLITSNNKLHVVVSPYMSLQGQPLHIDLWGHICIWLLAFYQALLAIRELFLFNYLIYYSCCKSEINTISPMSLYENVPLQDREDNYSNCISKPEFHIQSLNDMNFTTTIIKTHNTLHWSKLPPSLQVNLGYCSCNSTEMSVSLSWPISEPKTLVLHLKRFTSNGQKINTVIRSPAASITLPVRGTLAYLESSYHIIDIIAFY